MNNIINDIIDEFDFEKVHKVMGLLNWTWYIDYVHKIPNIDDMKKTASRILQNVLERNSENYYIATGGFKASMQDGYISLVFELTQWEHELTISEIRQLKIKNIIGNM